MITEHLSTGLLNTEKSLIYGILNTANYDVTAYVFIAGDTSDCLASVGCFDDDIDRADKLKIGESFQSENWPTETAIIMVKMKDDRQKNEE
jgi:hypothetical protein